MSGGPILDINGDVFGILSGALINEGKEYITVSKIDKTRIF